MSTAPPGLGAAAERVPSVRTAATAVLILAGAVMLAVRPALFAASDASPNERAVLLALLFGSLGAASLLPSMPADRAEAAPTAVFAVGVGAVAVAWWTAGPTAPLASAPLSIALSIAAAVAEEALFRRLAYGHLRRFGVPAAIGVTALVFAAIHVPAYGAAAFPVDLGAGLLFGWQRWASGTWTVPAATHAAANVLAVIR